jgi:hypothetical protein
MKMGRNKVIQHAAAQKLVHILSAAELEMQI